MLAKFCCLPVLALVVVAAVLPEGGAAIKPLSARAAAKINTWVTTSPQGQMKAYIMGKTAEINKGSHLLGFKAKVGLHSFTFNAPNLEFTAEYRTDENDQESRRVYPARIARASAMKITGTITLGGNDKNDLECEFDTTDRHLDGIMTDSGKEISKPWNSLADEEKYDRLITHTISDLGYDVRDKIKAVVFGADPN